MIITSHIHYLLIDPCRRWIKKEMQTDENLLIKKGKLQLNPRKRDDRSSSSAKISGEDKTFSFAVGTERLMSGVNSLTFSSSECNDTVSNYLNEADLDMHVEDEPEEEEQQKHYNFIQLIQNDNSVVGQLVHQDGEFIEHVEIIDRNHLNTSNAESNAAESPTMNSDLWNAKLPEHSTLEQTKDVGAPFYLLTTKLNGDDSVFIASLPSWTSDNVELENAIKADQSEEPQEVPLFKVVDNSGGWE